jgi:ribose/xylose/arabinose/galactoside ABC-type transport system permease subunit
VLGGSSLAPGTNSLFGYLFGVTGFAGLNNLPIDEASENLGANNQFIARLLTLQDEINTFMQTSGLSDSTKNSLQSINSQISHFISFFGKATMTDGH